MTNSSFAGNPTVSVRGYGRGIPGPDGGWQVRYDIRNIIMAEYFQGRRRKGTVLESVFMQDIHIWSALISILSSVWEDGLDGIGTEDIPASNADCWRTPDKSGLYCLMM